MSSFRWRDAFYTSPSCMQHIEAPTPTSEANHPPSAATTEPRKLSWMRITTELTKARLNALVVATTVVGFLLASVSTIDWWRLTIAMLGTALAAVSASMLNQVIERRRDALMLRTRRRPIPAGEVQPGFVFAAGCLIGFAGFALLVLQINMLTGVLAGANILIYVLLYTPLKPRTTMNTIVGAVCGAIPPLIGWTAVTGRIDPAAWVLAGILFVWQIPHFLALAWKYREDYARGGHAMLPVYDPDGRITSQVSLMTTLLLVPLVLSATVSGLTGWWSAAFGFFATLLFAALAVQFARYKDDRTARALFLGSIAWLPLILLAMVLDRGPVNVTAFLSGRPNDRIFEPNSPPPTETTP
ncbi:MAG: protoheme IX farnesyltransferase [Phycisphaerales bacterium]|nr:protoheme IX farnesyltransferase [Phycisphaerales bacterium]